MKIVDRKTFLALPENTVFAKYAPCYFGDLCIKTVTCGEDDFCAVEGIASCIDSDGSIDFTTRLDYAVESGESIDMDFDSTGRDGMFDKDQLFAVFDKKDVEQLIERLQRCL